LENFKGVKIQLNESNISILDILNELIKIKFIKIIIDGTIQSEWIIEYLHEFLAK